MLGMLVALSGCAHRSTPTPATSAPIANAVPPVFGYHVEIVARSAEVSELVVHAPCGAVTCERTARAMNFHNGRVVGLLDLAGAPMSLSAEGDGDQMASTLPPSAQRPVAVVVSHVHGGTATYTHLMLVGLLANPPEPLLSEQIAMRGDDGGGTWPVGRIELVHDPDSPDALAIWITQVTRTGPNARVGDLTSKPQRHRYVYVPDRDRYLRLE